MRLGARRRTTAHRSVASAKKRRLLARLALSHPTRCAGSRRTPPGRACGGRDAGRGGSTHLETYSVRLRHAIFFICSRIPRGHYLVWCVRVSLGLTITGRVDVTVMVSKLLRSD